MFRKNILLRKIHSNADFALNHFERGMNGKFTKGSTLEKSQNVQHVKWHLIESMIVNFTVRDAKLRAVITRKVHSNADFAQDHSIINLGRQIMNVFTQQNIRMLKVMKSL